MRKTILLLTIFCFTAVTHGVLAYPAGNSQSNDSLEQRLDNLARQISDGLTENQKHTIAVVEFSDLKGNVTNSADFFPKNLSLAFTRPRSSR